MDILERYAQFKSSAKAELILALKAQKELEHRIATLQIVVGDMSATKIRMPKGSSAVIRKSKGKRVVKGSADKKEWANAVAYAIKQHKNGAARKDIETMMRRKLPHGWQAAMQKHSGEKLRMEGMRSTAKYFVK